MISFGTNKKLQALHRNIQNKSKETLDSNAFEKLITE